MAEKIEGVRKELNSIEAWVKKLAQNAQTSPQEFMEESITLRDQVVKAYKNLAPRSIETGKAKDPMVAALEEAVMANEPAVRDQVRKLVYEGQLDPLAYYEVVIGILKQQSPMAHGFQDLRQVAMADVTAKGCAACSACAGCVLCAACGISGTIAAGAAGMAGAAGAYLA